MTTITKQQLDCYNCNKPFDIRFSASANIAELNRLFPECEGTPQNVLCDACFEEFSRWFNNLCNEHKIIIRDETRKFVENSNEYTKALKKCGIGNK